MASSRFPNLAFRKLSLVAGRLSIVGFSALALTLGYASPGSGIGTGALEQLSGPSGTDGCVSRDGTGGECAIDPALTSPQAIAVSPDGKHAYVAGGGSSSNLLIFTRNESAGSPSRGALTTAGIADAGSGPHAVIVSPDGKHVYVSANNGVFFLSRNSATGALTPIGCVSKTEATCTTPAVPQLKGPEGLAISPDGDHVYVAASGLPGVLVFARDPVSGALAPITPAGCVSEAGADGCSVGVGLKGAGDVTVSPDGNHVYVTADVSDAVAIFERNDSTGSLSQLAGIDGCWSQTGKSGPSGPVVCQDGRGLNGANGVVTTGDGKFVYVTSTTSNAIAIFSRDKTTGRLTQANSTEGCISQDGKDGTTAGVCTAAEVGGLDQVQKVVVSPDGRNLYTTASQSDAVSSFARDTTSGGLTQLNCVSSTDSACDAGVALRGAQGIAIAKDGKNVYTTAPQDNAVDAFARQ